MAKEWTDSGVLAPFTSISGAPTANTLEGLLAELERASRMTNAWIGCIAVYTGCKPDPTRYKPPQDADAGKAWATALVAMLTITRPPVTRHFPDDDMTRIPELSPLDSAQTKRAARQDRPRSSDQLSK